MKQLMRVAGIVLLLAIAAGCSGRATFNAYDSGRYDNSQHGMSALPTPPAGAGRYIVVFKDTVTDVPQAARAIAAAFGASPTHTYSHALKGFAVKLPQQALAGLRNHPLVDYIEPDLVVYAVGKPDKPGKPPPPPPDDTELQWGVDRIDADKNTGPKGLNVLVAVLDTGIDTDHPDLAANYVGGYDFVNNDASPEDDNGHGTHVAGIIAADDNGTGVIGVAPDAGLVAVKVLDSAGSGLLSWIIAGMDWIADPVNPLDIKVANMSFGGYFTSQSLHDAVIALQNAGVTIAAAAGNDKTNAAYFIPGSYPEVLCISALTEGDRFASYSNYGSVVDLIAPGTDVKSTWLGGGYNTISGTSMAAPHVAGAIALYLDDHSGTPDQVMQALIGAGEAPKRGKWRGDPDGIGEPLVDAETL